MKALAQLVRPSGPGSAQSAPSRGDGTPGGTPRFLAHVPHARPHRSVWHVLGGCLSFSLGVFLLCTGMSEASAQGIYTCTDSKGRRLTADRPIIECLDREQRVMNRDGSTRTVLPPSLTADERAELQAKEARKAQERAALQDAVRRDRLLLSRYPTEEEHRKAREAALDDVRSSIRNSESRIAELLKERKPLVTEQEFYKGRSMPPKLRQALEFVDVAIEAHKTLIQNQQSELQRISQLYDQDLERLRKLWAGAAPGSAP